MTAEISSGRRALLLSAAATSVLAACGGGGGGSGGGGSSSSSSSSSSVTVPALKTVFAGKFKVGMSADPGITNQPLSNAILLKHCNSLAPENVMKADPIGVSAGVYNFTQADALVNFAQAASLAVRGTTLLWHETSPSWFFAGDPLDAGYRALVRSRLETYITDVVTHFRGKIYAWDVVNEVVSDDASSDYRNSQWYQIFGNDYIEYAFRAARAADPTAQLFINDYSTEDGGKRARLMRIVDTMLARGVPIDGVGHQLHINTTYPAVSEVANALAAVEARSLINHVTELDVSLYNDSVTVYAVGTAAYNAAIKAQALQYRAMYNLFAAHPSVQSVTTWGVADNHTWLSFFPVVRLNHPLLFDTNGDPKPAFWAVVDPAFVP